MFISLVKRSEGLEKLRGLLMASQGQKLDSDSGTLADPGTPVLSTCGVSVITIKPNM